MAVQRFLARLEGRTKQIIALVTSAGVGDGGKLVATDPATGRLHGSVMPDGIGANTQQATASEAIGAGKFVNYHDDGGTFSIRLADNSNGRQADGFVLGAVADGAEGTVYPLGETNSALSSLTPGAEYWLATAGGVTDTPLDETDGANTNKISQRLGIAKAAGELITGDDGYVVL